MERESAHVCVLRDEAAELLCPALSVETSGVIVDCTVGLGGHSRALLERAGEAVTLIGIDVDAGNLKRAKLNLSEFRPRVRLFQANFSQVQVVLAEADAPAVDVLLADLGVASSQLDDPARGLSFQADGPLDMRLDDRLTTTAADLVNTLGEKALADVIYQYGQERLSRRIARRIVAVRKDHRIDSTIELAELVRRCYPPAKGRRRIHPATRTFQALRIAVNDEMASLEALLRTLPEIMAPGGRAGIISFHSLEDRRVKHAFAAMANEGRAKLMTKKPLVPTAQEIAENPRSRSAKLRGLERIERAMD